jgi:PAS domain S-box-containing protein
MEHSEAPNPGRQAEDQRQTEEMLRAIIESTAEGILVGDTTGQTVFANHRFAEMWRIPQEVLAARREDRLAFVLDQLEDPDAFLSKVQELYRTGREDLDTLLFKDGRVFERYSRPLMNDGQITGRVWSFRDVTDRRRSDQAIREAETKYRTLVEQIPAVTYIDAVEGPETTLYISPQTETMLGFTQADWLADPQLLSKRIHPDDRERWQAENAHIDATGDPFGLEYRIVARDGRMVWVHDEAVLVHDDRGDPQFWQGVMFDITERKQAEEHLQQALQREVEAAGRLRALDQMKNTFLEAVSHELRTPLTAILGSALTLEREDVELAPEESRDLVKRLAANARKLNRLLSDLLDLDRLARGIVEPKRAPTDLVALVRQVAGESESLQGRPVHIEAEPVVLALDGAKVERIVENLLANAVRHTPDGTPIWARVGPCPGGALLVVEDAGPGIPDAQREKIFEPFSQLPTTRPHPPGVGVGLSLVARFAELHGGSAWVEDRPGGGASFRVFLAGPPAESSEPPALEAAQGGSSPAA